MKDSISTFEKLLISIIIFVFCVIVLMQIFINNNVLDTIKANEEGTAVIFQGSQSSVPQGLVTLTATNINQIILLVNGEEVPKENKNSSSISLKLYQGDIVEVKNIKDDLETLQILNVSEEVKSPQASFIYECPKGITYLFKAEIKK
ncbi:MAG: hypothetical protein ACOWWR_16740 [Eubacteriales bacterium]